VSDGRPDLVFLRLGSVNTDMMHARPPQISSKGDFTLAVVVLVTGFGTEADGTYVGGYSKMFFILVPVLTYINTYAWEILIVTTSAPSQLFIAAGLQVCFKNKQDSFRFLLLPQ